MKDDLFIQKLKEDIRRSGERPLEELYRDLKEEGIVDDQGHIIVRMPEPPKGGQQRNQSKKRRTREGKNDIDPRNGSGPIPVSTSG